MAEWIDFRELRSKLNFKDVLEKYQVRLQIRAGGKQGTARCPLPNHGENHTKQSFSANLEKGIFQCFHCGAKGNVLEFACLMENRDPSKGEDLRTVALDLAKEFQIPTGLPLKSQCNHRPIAKGAIPESNWVFVNAPLDFELKGLDPKHEYLRKRNLTEQTIKMFGLGYCSRGSLVGRIAIPLHDIQQNLIGFVGRAVSDSNHKSVPKYLFPGTRTHNGVTHEFKKSLVLYNANRIPKPCDDLIIVEGFVSVWWLTQNGFPNCVAVMGANISQEQAKIVCNLVREDGRITIFPDQDEVGKKFATQAKAIFAGKIQIRVIKADDGSQPTDFSPSELMDLLGNDEEQPAGIGGGVSPRHDICRLIDQFPCFANLHISPERWDAVAFERQAGKFSSGELSVAQFILGLWNPTTTWKCGKFDLIEAAARLDATHREVIIDWFSDPWWP